MLEERGRVLLILGGGDHRVHRRAIDGTIDRQRQQLSASFGAEQFDLQLLWLMRGPETLDQQTRAIVEANDATSVVVGGVLGGLVYRTLAGDPPAPAITGEPI